MLQTRIEKLKVDFFELHQNLLQRGIFQNDVEFKTAKLKYYAELGADFSELTQKLKRKSVELTAEFCAHFSELTQKLKRKSVELTAEIFRTDSEKNLV